MLELLVDSHWPRPNGSRLSCGRLARRRKAVGRSPCPARGTTLRFPLERLAPASFKRLLGGRLPWRQVEIGSGSCRPRLDPPDPGIREPVTATERTLGPVAAD